MSKKWRCRLQRISFGLTDKYMENVYEQFFFLMYHGKWDFQQSYNLPVGLREWFTKRLLKQLEDEKEARESASSNKKTHTIPSNLPDY